jgi:hypothetical protein
MVYTIIGDPHAKPSNLDKIEKLFSIVEDLANPTIWLGDFLDTKEVIRGTCLNLIYSKLKQSKVFHYILIGNHDYFNLECKDHTLEVLKELPNVKIVDQVTYVSDLGYMIPYVHDQGKLKEMLRLIDGGEVLFAHLDITGFDYGNGHICDSGITLSDLKKFKLVVSGHFHKRQFIKNVEYLGTPFSHSFGESNQEKCIATYQPNTGDFTHIKTNFPEHKTIQLNCDNNPKLPGISSNDIIRIILTGNKENIIKFKETTDLKFAAQVLERPSNYNSNQIVVNEELDNETKFSQWASDIQKWDTETIKLGLEILQLAKK